MFVEIKNRSFSVSVWREPSLPGPPGGYPWVVPGLVGNDRDVPIGLLVRAVEDHKGLAFDALDLDLDPEQPVLSGTAQDPDVWGAVLSMRLHLWTEMKRLLQPGVRPD